MILSSLDNKTARKQPISESTKDHSKDFSLTFLSHRTAAELIWDKVTQWLSDVNLGLNIFFQEVSPDNFISSLNHLSIYMDKFVSSLSEAFYTRVLKSREIIYKFISCPESSPSLCLQLFRKDAKYSCQKSQSPWLNSFWKRAIISLKLQIDTCCSLTKMCTLHKINQKFDFIVTLKTLCLPLKRSFGAFFMGINSLLFFLPIIVVFKGCTKTFVHSSFSRPHPRRQCLCWREEVALSISSMNGLFCWPHYLSLLMWKKKQFFF